jgi:FMN phosphatase YigB (HAD superfamily)
MMAEATRAAIADLAFDGRPLVICDVDDVIVHFLRDFEDFLAGHGLWFDPASFALHGNVRSIAGNVAVAAETVTALVLACFAERARHFEAIDGAVQALNRLAGDAQVVLLSNLPAEAAEDRRHNLTGLGLGFPLIVNSGPKGPAVRLLAERAGTPAVFIDDSPSFIASAREHAPEVALVHFLHDRRFARHVPDFDYLSLRTASWADARPHIEALFSGGDRRSDSISRT